MMWATKRKHLLYAVLVWVLASPAGAELSEKHAAIVAGSERTKLYIAEQNYEAALQSAQATYELSVQSLGMNDPNTALLAEEYARLLGATGNREQAVQPAERAGVPFVTTFHGVYGTGNPLKKLYNSSMVRADRIIAISDYIRQHILATYRVDPDRVRTIPRGVDLDIFSPERVSPERVILHARLVWPKCSVPQRCRNRLSSLVSIGLRRIIPRG